MSHSNSGISHYACCLGAALSESVEWDVHLLTHQEVECRDAGAMHIARLFRRSRWLFLDLFRVASYLHRNRIEVLHLQSTIKYPVLTYLVIRLAHLAGMKVIFTAHDVLPHYARFYHRRVMRAIYEQVDGVIVHSKSNMAMLRGVAPGVNRLAVIPHGVYDVFAGRELFDKAEARRRLGMEASARLLLFFGRIDERKGAAALIGQLPRLVARIPDLCVLMVGRSAYAPGELEALAAQKGMEGHLVIDARWVADKEVGAFFTAADATVLPYLEGSTSGVIKIALATATPVIATRVGDLPEIIEETGCGVLINMPPTDVEIDEIARMLSKGHGTHTSRGAWEKEWSWPVIAVRTRAFYEETFAG